MIARADALEALASETFDVVVVGGGITGAGVAFDAATRGYSVALVERADYAAGTSSRSSKLVHGGLRYLQNFDLGLVREALLERQLMVALAPHLVWPLPLVVAAFDGDRPDRRTGVGLNLYDVMSVERLRRPARPRLRGRGSTAATAPAAGDFSEWSPERHRTVSGEEVLELVPALADREPTSGYLFYDCQTDDVRLVLTVLGRGRALRRGLRERRRGDSSSCATARGARRACAAARRARAQPASSSCARRTSSTRRASGPTACGRASCTTRRRCRASGRVAGRTSRCATRTSR